MSFARRPPPPGWFANRQMPVFVLGNEGSLCSGNGGGAYARAQVGQSPEDYNQVGAAQSFMTPGGGNVYITDSPNAPGPNQVPYSTPSAGVQMYPPGASPYNYGSQGYYAPCPDGYIADGYGGCYNLGYSQPGMAYGPLPAGYQPFQTCPPCPSCPPCAASHPRVVSRRR